MRMGDLLDGKIPENTFWTYEKFHCKEELHQSSS